VWDPVKRFMGRNRGFHIAESEAQHALCNVKKERGGLVSIFISICEEKEGDT